MFRFLGKITTCSVPEPYTIYWKILNRGDEALKNDNVRGQIQMGYSSHTEPTSFRGNHYVECYIVKDNVCVAMDRQSVFIV